MVTVMVMVMMAMVTTVTMVGMADVEMHEVVCNRSLQQSAQIRYTKQAQGKRTKRSALIGFGNFMRRGRRRRKIAS
jgi:hypothetical protein